MAHYRKSLAAAVALNSEAVAGYQAGSLCLIMDSIHNFSDELALVALYLAFILSQGVSRHLLRTANVFNSVGLIAVSGLLLWQAGERLVHPAPVQGTVVIITGLLAAAANWGVARLLIKPAQNNAAIRLAYIHNVGDVWVSLAPVAAGLLLSLTGYSFFSRQTRTKPQQAGNEWAYWKTIWRLACSGIHSAFPVFCCDAGARVDAAQSGRKISGEGRQIRGDTPMKRPASRKKSRRPSCSWPRRPARATSPARCYPSWVAIQAAEIVGGVSAAFRGSA